MGKKAVIFGASGMVGRQLLRVMIDSDDYKEIVIVMRTPFQFQHSKLTQIIADFSTIENHKQALQADAFFCCLGTTRKKTPDLKQYYQIDHDYPLKAAQIAKELGVKQYHLVSALGANAESKIFYSRTKGEVENDIISLQLPATYVYRPSLLVGKRKEKRLGEKVGEILLKMFNPLLFGKGKHWRSIKASQVAYKMYQNSLKPKDGIHIILSEDIKKG